MKTQPILLFLLIFCCYGCKQHDSVISTTTSPDARMADSLAKLGNDSAFYYYNEVANNSKNDSLIARAYNRMAKLQYDAGDYDGSHGYVIESLKHLDEKRERDYPGLSANYNLLGRGYLELGEYDNAIKYFELTLKLLKAENYKSIASNNIAVAYQKKEMYANAISTLQSVLERNRDDSIEYSRSLSNLARTKWLENSHYDAAPEMLEALRIREMKNDRLGINASYSHLADYYLTSHPDSALMYAEKMYGVAQSPDDKLAALEKMIKVGDPKKIREYALRHFALNDSLQDARNRSKNQFAVIRYEAEKSKAENFRLQQENLKQRIISFSAVLLVIIAILWYRRRKQKMEWASQNAIRENELKTSKKVHDVVANGLYRIITDIEHRDELDKERLMDQIEALYEQSRDISYDKPDTSPQNFSEALHATLTSFATPTTRILIVGNQQELWNEASSQVKNELQHVLQELMVNMAKHSEANNVLISFRHESDHLIIRYKDDGIGLSPEFQYGNGLRNTENRIKSIGGRIILDRNTDSGLKIDISLPLSKSK